MKEVYSGQGNGGPAQQSKNDAKQVRASYHGWRKRLCIRRLRPVLWTILLGSPVIAGLLPTATASTRVEVVLMLGLVDLAVIGCLLLSRSPSGRINPDLLVLLTILAVNIPIAHGTTYIGGFNNPFVFALSYMFITGIIIPAHPLALVLAHAISIGYLFFANWIDSAPAAWDQEKLQVGLLLLLIATVCNTASFFVRRLQFAEFEARGELKQLANRFRVLANVDSLTQVANRRAFDQALDREWRRMQRAHRPMTLILADIDEFKHFNDNYGHLAGDVCLQTIAQTLRAHVRRPGDVVARYGGEEFAIVLPTVNAEQGKELAEKLRRAVYNLKIPHEGSRVGPYVTLSLGTATLIPSTEFGPGELIRRADLVLYRAKDSGRNRSYVYSGG